jgi:hypothetical protein
VAHHCGERRDCSHESFDSVPIGDISVILHTWTASTPYPSLNMASIAGGQADPPITVRSSDEKRTPASRM